MSKVPRPFTSMLPPSRTTRRPRNSGRPHVPFEFRSELVVRGVIFLPIVVLGPGIEMPVRNRTFTLARCAQKSVRNRESIRDWWEHEKNPLPKDSLRPFSECRERRAPRPRSRQEFARARLAKVAHNIRVDPRNRREFPGPVRFFMRPREPCGRVRFPFRRHPVAKSTGASVPREPWRVLHFARGLHSSHRSRMGE